jgi:PAS domain S-box-containing protein
MEKRHLPWLALAGAGAVLLAAWLPYASPVFALLLAGALWRASATPDASSRVDALRSFVEQSLVGMYFVDGTHIVYGNQAMADMLGRSRNELGQLPITQIIHPADLDLVRSNLQRRLSGELDYLQYVFRIVRGDGAVRHVEVHSHRAVVDGRNLVVGVMLDRTELVDTQAELARYAKVFEASSEGVMVTDAKGHVLTVNPAVLTQTGFSRDDLYGKSLYELEAEAGNGAFAESLRPVVKQGFWQGEIQALRRDGSRYPARMSVDAIRDADGNAIQYVAHPEQSQRRQTGRTSAARVGATIPRLCRVVARGSLRGSGWVTDVRQPDIGADAWLCQRRRDGGRGGGGADRVG